MTSQNRNYRGWTSVEEAKLVEALVNMVNGGQFKADNGFKTGYLLHLEQIIKQTLPTSGLLGKPHIESKIKVMKKDGKIVHDMVTGSNTSGFGYDAATHCVVVEPDIWDAYLKAHKGDSKWKNKAFLIMNTCVSYLAKTVLKVATLKIIQMLKRKPTMKKKHKKWMMILMIL